LDFFRRCWGVKIEQRFDISAHSLILSPDPGYNASMTIEDPWTSLMPNVS
jgi:hypothetical protein